MDITIEQRKYLNQKEAIEAEKELISANIRGLKAQLMDLELREDLMDRDYKLFSEEVQRVQNIENQEDSIEEVTDVSPRQRKLKA